MKHSFKRCKSKYQIIFSEEFVITQETNIGIGNLVTFLLNFLFLVLHFLFFPSFFTAFLPTLVQGFLFI